MAAIAAIATVRRANAVIVVQHRSRLLHLFRVVEVEFRFEKFRKCCHCDLLFDISLHISENIDVWLPSIFDGFSDFGAQIRRHRDIVAATAQIRSARRQ